MEIAATVNLMREIVQGVEAVLKNITTTEAMGIFSQNLPTTSLIPQKLGTAYVLSLLPV